MNFKNLVFYFIYTIILIFILNNYYVDKSNILKNETIEAKVINKYCWGRYDKIEVKYKKKVYKVTVNEEFCKKTNMGQIIHLYCNKTYDYLYSDLKSYTAIFASLIIMFILLIYFTVLIKIGH